ncbi:MAG: aspartate--tRNA ligase [Patescibacteria group bacterium]
MQRTLTKNLSENIGKQVNVLGWVNTRRDHGKIIFIDARDRWGIVQCVFVPGNEAYETGQKLRTEFVVSLKGLVKKRPESMINTKIATGEIELEVQECEILNESETVPFEIDKDTKDTNEETRLKYKYLDIRSERIKESLCKRAELIGFIRNYLAEREFIEIETPMLTKSTPEGARDYVVPSRLQAGNFYALPQSPQQFKQLLMVGGIERYFQIAKCLRDEDSRGDRQPEHTQLDIEMSFFSRDELLDLVENLMIETIKKTYPEKKLTFTPFKRLTHKESMEQYKTDKPDLRVDKNNPDELAFVWILDFPLFERNDKGELTYSHNPFTSPKKDEIEFVMKGEKLEELSSEQYDLACNGYEIGSGSIRINQPEILEKIFEILGHSKEKTKEQFGHILQAFKYGAPPHGGIAWGLDRLVMILQNEPNIREVIAFPKTGDGRDLMMSAPSEISDLQLKELHLQIKK